MKTFVSSQVALYIGMVLAAQVGFLLRFVIPGISAGESVVWVLGPDAIVIMAGITAVSLHRRFCFLVRTDGETTVHVWGIGIDCRFHREESQFELLSWRRLKLSSKDFSVIFTPDISGFSYLRAMAREWAAAGTGGPIALYGAVAGYGVRAIRVNLRPPFDLAAFLKAMKWAVMISLPLAPLVFVFVFALLWLTAATGQDLIEDPPRWFIPG